MKKFTLKKRQDATGSVAGAGVKATVDLDNTHVGEPPLQKLEKRTELRISDFGSKNIWYRGAANQNRLWLSQEEIQDLLETLYYYEQNHDMVDNRAYATCEECGGTGQLYHKRSCAEDDEGYYQCGYCYGKGRVINYE